MSKNARNFRKGNFPSRLNTVCALMFILYTMPTYAYRSQTLDNIWTDSTHTIPAKNICESGCDSYCWLPNGTYYDTTGRFTERCEVSCRSGEYDIGVDQCVSPNTGGTGYGAYWDFGGDNQGVSAYGLTGSGQWAVEFSYGIVKGIASCNGTSANYASATDTEFSNTVTGRHCWCKMTSPATSKWVYRYTNLTSGICEDYCAYRCTEYVNGDSEYRLGLFSAVAQPGVLDQAYAQGLKDCAEP